MKQQIFDDFSLSKNNIPFYFFLWEIRPQYLDFEIVSDHFGTLRITGLTVLN